MSPEQREAMLAEADVHGCAREHWAEILDALTERGFSISLASVRDHTNCRKDGAWPCIDGSVCGHVIGCGDRPCSVRIPCGGSPVVWSTEP